ncbi:MAG: ribonuclease P protein component [Clostridia bacterium]|jgi:ribonuclease P protein component|nr:ribonuclease P protein component [Clostridia bacterium]
MTVDYRLKKQKDFDLVFKKGKKIFSNTLTLLYFNAEDFKVGFCVSKKHGKSVMRNRIKRLLRESFRSFTPYLRQNFFFVFIPKVCDSYSLDTYKKDMEYLLKKGGLLKENA